MSEFQKVYVGKGKLVDGLSFPVIRLTLKMEELASLAREFEGHKIVTIEVRETKEPDSHGRTHTAYVNNKIVPEPPKKGRGKK